MNTKPPLYGHQKRNSCALACLRMVHAAFGTEVEEGAREAEADMEPEGVEIGELGRLARRFGLIANVQEATVEQLRRFLTEESSRSPTSSVPYSRREDLLNSEAR
jgi:ABC-type bacteriocin/lantibiotic exporter with double-glycine peptidase domain